MSREARHASNSKKGTPRGSSSFSSNDATETRIAEPFGQEASAAKPTQVETDKAEDPKASKPIDPTVSTAKPIELGTKPDKTKSRRIIIVLAIVLGVLLAIAGYGILELAKTGHQAEQIRAESETHMIAEPAEPSFDLAENPIDFAAEQAKAPDTYAWIYVPNTNINLPIMRHPTDDNFYLKHTSDGEESQIGAIYTQSVNSADFSDPVTVIYGHNFPQFDVMFTELHNFEDSAFFDANEEFYIYMPGRALTYKVVAAYEYDNRHIMNSFDFSDQAVVQEYFDSVLSPESDVAHVREGASLSAAGGGATGGGATSTEGAGATGAGGIGSTGAAGAGGIGSTGDKIVQLSTCTNPSDPAKRYIVTGVLVSDDPTL